MKVNTNGINHSNLETESIYSARRESEKFTANNPTPSGNWSTRDCDNFAYYVSAKFMEKVRVAAIVSRRMLFNVIGMICLNVIWLNVTFTFSMTNIKLSFIAILQYFIKWSYFTRISYSKKLGHGSYLCIPLINDYITKTHENESFSFYTNNYRL